MQQLIVARYSLQRMANRMPEIENGAQVVLALILRYNLRLDAQPL